VSNSSAPSTMPTIFRAFIRFSLLIAPLALLVPRGSRLIAPLARLARFPALAERSTPGPRYLSPGQQAGVSPVG
jgi:hypothetical protein